MRIFKQCRCGHVFLEVPEQAVFHLTDEANTFPTGYYWLCDCRSTICYPTEKPEEEKVA